MTSSGSSTPSLSSSEDAPIPPGQALRDAMEATEKLHDMLAKSWEDSSSPSENSDVQSRQGDLIAREAEEATNQLHDLLAVRTVATSSSSEVSSEERDDRSSTSTEHYSEEWESSPSVSDFIHHVEQAQRSSGDDDWLLIRNTTRGELVHTSPPLAEAIPNALSVASSTFIEEWIDDEPETSWRANAEAAILPQDSLTWRPGIDVEEEAELAEYEESVAEDLSPKSSPGRHDVVDLKEVEPPKIGHGDSPIPTQKTTQARLVEESHREATFPADKEARIGQVDSRPPNTMSHPPQASTCDISVQVGSMYEKGCQVEFDEPSRILFDSSELRPSWKKPLEKVKTGQGWSMLSELLVTLEKYNSPPNKMDQDSGRESNPEPKVGTSHSETRSRNEKTPAGNVHNVWPIQRTSMGNVSHPILRAGVNEDTECLNRSRRTETEGIPLAPRNESTHLELDMVIQGMGGMSVRDVVTNVTIDNLHRQELASVKHVLRMVKQSGSAGPRSYVEMTSGLTLPATLAYIDAHKPYQNERSGSRNVSAR
ncbi:hypothetical protein BSKO_03609 [Bryopsis sp. KO-2023]|nr:hypothetical protein BSKO_03609 [Bryopsis sp. KO-2023]